jgi:hypothetical protein
MVTKRKLAKVVLSAGEPMGPVGTEPDSGSSNKKTGSVGLQILT